MADVKYVISVDSTGATQKIQSFDKAIDDLGKTTAKADSTFGSMWKQFAIGQIVVNALRDGWRLFKDQVGDSIKAAMEAEKANKSLDAALELTGRNAAKLGDHFKAYADSLMAVTVYDDEVIKSAQALLIQLTNLNREGIDKATRGAIGLASVFGMDLTSAATLVAKAMTGNTAALSRYGIRVAENLSAEQKQVQLLDQLQKMFGRATAETGTFDGQLKQLKVRWGEVQEAAGKWVTQQKGIIEILNKASQTILDYLTMGEMLDKSTANQVEQEDRLADRLGKAAAAAGWQYREMAKLIESYGGITPALISAINHEKYGVEIKNAYVAALRDEKGAWEKVEAARLKAERGSGGLDAGIKTTTKLVETEVYHIDGLFHALTRLGATALPEPKGLPEAQMKWLGLGTQVKTTRDVWDSALAAMTAGLASFGDSNASIWANVGAVFGNFVEKFIGGAESIVLKEIWMATMASKADRVEAQSAVAKWWLKILPPPFSFIAAAASAAVVNSLFAKILKFEKGGFMDKPGIVEVGHGPEYILPEARLERLIERTVTVKERTGGRGGGGGNVYVNLTVNTQRLDDTAIYELAPKISRALRRELVYGERY